MTPLTANLKQLYQCHIIWIYHCMIIPAIVIGSKSFYRFDDTASSKMHIALPLQLFYFFGLGMGQLVADVLSKPFAICLPGHIKTAQKMLFLIWLTITLTCSLTSAVLFFIGINTDYALFAGATGLISLSYWIGVAGMVIRRLKLIPIIYFSIICICFFTNKIIEPILIIHPWVIALFGGIGSYLIYRAVDSRDNIRRLSAMPWLGVPTAYKIANQQKYKQERLRMKQTHKINRVTELTGNLFTEHIRSQHNSSLLAHLWGQIYLTITPVITYWKWIFLCSILIISFCFIFQLEGMELFLFEFVMFILASFLGSTICRNFRFENFLPIGRREYFWRGIVVLFSATLITISFLGTSVLIFNQLSKILPPITVMGQSFKITSIRWILLVVPIIMLPFFGGLFVLLKKEMMVVIFILMIITPIIISYAINNPENISFIFDIRFVFSIAALAWGFHIAALHYDSMKRSLC